MEKFTIEHYKFAEIDFELMQTLKGIVRAPDSWLAKLTNDIFPEKRTKNFDVYILRDENHKVLGWCTGSRATIGFAPDVSKKVRCIEFNICVREGQRGKGIATKLLTFAKKNLRHKKRKWISFPFDEKGKRCYEKNKITTFRKGVDKEYEVIYP